MTKEREGKKERIHENGTSCETGGGVVLREISKSYDKLIGELLDDVVVANNSRES